MKNQSEPALFGVVVYDDVEPIDLGATVGVLSMARRVLPGISVIVVAEKAGTVELTSGLRIVADHSFNDCPALDVLIVCGGAGWRKQVGNDKMLSFLRDANAEIVSSVCTGGLILAKSGLLDGKAATTRRFAVGAEDTSPLEMLRCNHPITTYAAAVVDSGRTVTGGGVSLAIDATLHLIERIYGKNAADGVTDLIEYTAARAANQNSLGTVTTA